jgi:hypothetical protein
MLVFQKNSKRSASSAVQPVVGKRAKGGLLCGLGLGLGYGLGLGLGPNPNPTNPNPNLTLTLTITPPNFSAKLDYFHDLLHVVTGIEGRDRDTLGSSHDVLYAELLDVKKELRPTKTPHPIRWCDHHLPRENNHSIVLEQEEGGLLPTQQLHYTALEQQSATVPPEDLHHTALEQQRGPVLPEHDDEV